MKKIISPAPLRSQHLSMRPFENLHALAVAEDCVPLLTPLLLTSFHLPWKLKFLLLRSMEWDDCC